MGRFEQRTNIASLEVVDRLTPDAGWKHGAGGSIIWRYSARSFPLENKYMYICSDSGHG